MLKKFSTHKQERKHIRMSADFALPLIGNAPYMKRRLWIFGFFAFQVDMNRFCIAVSLESPSRIYVRLRCCWWSVSGAGGNLRKRSMCVNRFCIVVCWESLSRLSHVLAWSEFPLKSFPLVPWVNFTNGNATNSEIIHSLRVFVQLECCNILSKWSHIENGRWSKHFSPSWCCTNALKLC